jgi:hypothetical protein
LLRRISGCRSWIGTPHAPVRYIVLIKRDNVALRDGCCSAAPMGAQMEAASENAEGAIQARGGWLARPHLNRSKKLVTLCLRLAANGLGARGTA